MNAIAEQSNLIGKVSDLHRIVFSTPYDKTSRFDFRAVVVIPSSKQSGTIVLSDDSGFVSVTDIVYSEHPALKSGDYIHIAGAISTDAAGNRVPMAKSISVLGHRGIPDLTNATIKDINKGKYIDSPLIVTGLVTDAFLDEIDPNFIFLTIADGMEIVRMAIPYHGEDKKRISLMIGATIRSVAHCSGHLNTATRAKSGIEISVTDLNSVEIIQAAPEDPFSVPVLYETIQDINTFQTEGLARKRISGHVIAVCTHSTILIKDRHNNIAKVQLSTQDLPFYGQYVDVAGTPETDLYHLNLSRAVWRPSSGPEFHLDIPEKVTAEWMFTDEQGQSKIKAGYHGKTISIQGRIQALPIAGINDCSFNLECGNFTIPVEFPSFPQVLKDMSQNCIVEVTGTCVMDVEHWRPQAPVPHINGFSIAIRTPEDIKVISRPPWWTIPRLMFIIAALIAVLVVTVVWNRILKHLVERRSRELLRAQISKLNADMRIDERTRLAVELHDSVAQNLTGVSLQIDAAKRFAVTDKEKMLKHLNIASQTLLSCRSELRNCLWDLRSHALEEPDLETAIRRTVQPHIGDAALRIRFNVPRSRLSDPTAHALFRIIRELAANAVRHGHASQIKIAGSIDKDRLLFSVKDNGTGFDVNSAPGITQGHFGLQGVHERVRHLNGTMTIDSTPGNGAYFCITLPSVVASIIKN